MSLKCRKIADTRKRMKTCHELNDAQDYKQCYPLALKLAQEGHAPAQNMTAVYLQEGSGVTQDYTQAIYWYSKAATNGSRDALSNLGLTYYNGTGVSKNLELALSYHIKAAERGDVDSQHYLGCMYQKGQGTIPNNELALKWYLRAAAQGDAAAQFAVSCLYDNAKKEEKASAEWCWKAAMQGHVYALYNTGYNYRNGCGVEKNLPISFQWFTKAAEKGDAQAQYILGSEYYSGRNEFGATRDRTLGLEWLRKAAEQKLEEAHKMLAALKEEKDPDALSYYHIALCYRYHWVLKDDEDATNEKTYLGLASLGGYHRATLELAQLHERHARIWFAKANDRSSLSFSYGMLIDTLMGISHFPFELSVLCLSFLEKEVQLVLPRRKRKYL